MIEIFALASCFYFNAHPEWDVCKTMGRHYTYSTAEECERWRKAQPDGHEGDRGIKFICVKKTINTWQPVQPVQEGQ
jgi:hypothetical protein